MAGEKKDARRSRRRTTGESTKKRRFDYPRAGKGPIRRWLPSWRVVLGAAVTGIAVVVGLFAAAYISTDIPEPGDFAQAQGTNVYFADDETQMGSFAEFNRQIVDMATLPEHVGQAVVASEDRRFYENVGVDPIAIGRALWSNLRGNPTQGGSTLTQQYVERYYLGTTTSYVGKFREAILALKIDREQTKDAILGDYLNTIYFGRNAYGIETAAQNYFGKPAAELTLSESAMLAGIIPSPNNYDPAVNPERAEERWARTLDFMVRDGWITQEEADAQTFPEVAEYVRSDNYAGPTGYLLDMARQELVTEAGLTEEQIDTLGLHIRTTVDVEAQAAAVEVVDALPEDRPENNRVALVSVDPENGAVIALYGGPDFITQSRNAATQDVAQAGSTFKPFALVAALQEGIGLDSTYPSYTPMEIDGFDKPVNNYDQFNRGWVDLVTATEQSVNTSYALLNVEVGPDKTMQAAIDAGYPEDTAGLSATPSNVLGPSSPHPIDVARAFATFAAQGVRHETHIVAEVIDGDGNTIYTGGSPGTEVFDPDVMAEATYAMTKVIEEGTGVRARDIDRPAAGKTGTSNEGRSAWFAGYTPQLTTVVAMYQVGEDGGEESLTPFGEYADITGSTYPTTMWRDFMVDVLADEPIEEFPDRPAPQTPTPRPEPTREPTSEPTTEEEPQTVSVPGVVGQDEASAVAAITAAGLVPEVTRSESDEPEGTVVSTLPGSGNAVEPGSTVTIVVSSGPPEPTPTPEPTEEPTTEPPPPPTEEPPTEDDDEVPEPGAGGRPGQDGAGSGQGGPGNGRDRPGG